MASRHLRTAKRFLANALALQIGLPLQRSNAPPNSAYAAIRHFLAFSTHWFTCLAYSSLLHAAVVSFGGVGGLGRRGATHRPPSAATMAARVLGPTMPS